MKSIRSLLFLVLFTGAALAQANNCDLVLNDLSRKVKILFSDRPNLTLTELKVNSAPVPTDLPSEENRKQITKRVAGAANAHPFYSGDYVHTVFYPNAGYDSSVSFLIFNHARTVVAVDQHPFVKDPKATINPLHPGESDIDYTFFKNVEMVNSMGSAILFRLFSEIPNFRLRKVWALSEPVEVRKKSISNLTPVIRIAYHGVIEFDTGKGTPINTYIHIDDFVSKDYMRDKKPWWASKLDDLQVNAMLIKGSMHVMDHLQRNNPPQSVGEDIISLFRKKGGLIADGDRVNWPWPDDLEDAFISHRIRVRHSSINNFGYSQHGVRFFDFLPPTLELRK